MNYKPDFLIKPYEVHSHPGLRPSDSDVYAVVYWFERMKDGKCTAGNETIAEVARLKERTIGAALERLEKFGFITRVYEDAKRTKRLEIRTLVHMTRTSTVPVKEKKTKANTRREDKQTQSMVVVPPGEEKAPKEPTPGQIARDFFDPKGQTRSRIIDELAAQAGAPREAVAAEVKKFYLYWTEPNKSGTKQLWETKPTFEVKRRLYTWLSRAGKFNTAGKKGSGAGATI